MSAERHSISPPICLCMASLPETSGSGNRSSPALLDRLCHPRCAGDEAGRRRALAAAMLPYLEDGLLSWDVCQPDLYMKIFSRAQPQLLVLGLLETSSAWAGRTLHLVITW